MLKLLEIFKLLQLNRTLLSRCLFRDWHRRLTTDVVHLVEATAMSADSWLYSDEEVADAPPMELRDSLKKRSEMRSVCV